MKAPKQPLDDIAAKNDGAATLNLSDASMTSKKRKRMEKYIALKLRKEERVDLIAKLAESSITSKLLKRSKTLGNGKDTTRQRVQRSLVLERAGLPVEDQDLYQEVSAQDADDADIPEITPPKLLPLAVPHDMPKPFSLQVCHSVAPRAKEIGTTGRQDSSDSEQDIAAPTTDTTLADSKPAFYVSVNRPEAIQVARLQLPVVSEEQPIMEAIRESSVLILSGETGSGKTTQVPQFLYEAGYGHPDSPENSGMIGITQPRRVAAISMASRVASELGLSDREVSYQIRYDATVSASTRIKFMTDGVLLKEISGDFLLSKYSCIIIDEAHERSLNTDILIGFLSRIVLLRNNYRESTATKSGKPIKPLKLIIMSATLKVDDFATNLKLFAKPPRTISVPSRQHPVTMHFNRITSDDYITEAFKKVSKIHRKLPGGGILVFLTGQNEILDLCRRLKKQFPKVVDLTDGSAGKVETVKSDVAIDELEGRDDYDDLESSDDEEDEAEFMKGVEPATEAEKSKIGPLYVLPLYSSLSPEDQLRVFQEAPEGSRMCIVATNIAETSLTIPNIKYVVDCGRVKERHFDSKGASSFDIQWISKASANQRSGRSGRTGPGHSYRLYSSALFHNQFADFSVPEISRSCIEGVVLQMKDMSIENVVNFPFVSPPPAQNLRTAEKLLKTLGALDDKGAITALGKRMALLPVAPRFARILIGGCSEYPCPAQCATMVAALSVGDPFLKGKSDATEDAQDDVEWTEKSQFRILKEMSSGIGSDIVRYVRAYEGYDDSLDKEHYCKENYLLSKPMREIKLLREQLLNTVARLYPEFDSIRYEKTPCMDATAIANLRMCLLTGFLDRVAILNTNVNKTYVSETAYKVLVTSSTAEEQLVYIHPSSSFHRSPPDMVSYQELSVSSKGTKVYMKGVTEIQPGWLISTAAKLCTYSKPLDCPAPYYDPARDMVLCSVTPRYGTYSYDLPPVEMPHPANADRARIFLHALLEGRVFSKLGKFTAALLSKPSIVINARIPVTHSKLFTLIHPLIAKEVDGKAKMLELWKSDPRFLLEAYLFWVPFDLQNQVRAMWPPIS